MISKSYAQALAKKKSLFIPFVVLGDPDRKLSLETVRTLMRSGADALELGFPFSDPPADGPVIQAADNRALRAGIKIDDCFEMLTEIRSETDIPIGLLVYFNLVLQRGIAKFYEDCARAGVTSVLVADLPIEHADEAVAAAKKNAIAPVFLISELTTNERLQRIAKIAEGYLYVVSYLGVTGVADAVESEPLKALIDRARKCTALPLFVGFGIRTVEQAQNAVIAGADGVIVGSRVVEAAHYGDVGRVCGEFAECLKQ